MYMKKTTNLHRQTDHIKLYQVHLSSCENYNNDNFSTGDKSCLVDKTILLQ
jgi:hypothetical protein